MRQGIARRLGALAFALALVGSACGSDDDSAEATEASSSAQPSTTTHRSAGYERTSINPWQWSVDLGFNQGELVRNATTTLHLAGQSAMSADGEPMHEGDLAAQITLSLDNIEAVLAEADMSLRDVVKLDIYTTNVDALFENYGLIAERLGDAGVHPPGSLIGVARLAYPQLMVELVATASK